MATAANLYGRNEFRKQPEPVNVAEIVRELAESRSKPTPLWRRDRGLNLFGALCKNPQELTASLSGNPDKISGTHHLI